jgi:oligopeptide transport system substrate-binding protein
MAALFAVFFVFIHNCSAETIRLRLMDEPTTLDWHLQATSLETPLMMNLMEGLVTVDQDLKIVPALAERMIVEKSGKRYRFPIRKDAKWSDGREVRAQDFVDGFERLLSRSTAAPYASLYFAIQGAKAFHAGTEKSFSAVGVRAQGREVTIDLESPLAFFPSLLGFWPSFPIRKELISKYGNQWTRPGKMVTTGAYALESVKPQSKYTLKANANYYGKRGRVDLAEFLIVRESSTAIRLFNTGNLNLVQDFSPEDLSSVRKRPDYRAFPYLKLGYLALRTTGCATENVHLRRALAQGFDRAGLMKVLQFPLSASAGSLVPKGLFGYDPSITLPTNIKVAQAELKKSGYNVAEPIKIISRNNERPRLITQYLQSEWKKNLGLQVLIQMVDHKIFRSQILAECFPVTVLTWGADYPDSDTFLSLFETGVVNNYSKTSLPALDRLISKSRSLTDEQARKPLIRQAQQTILQDHASAIPLFYEANEAIVTPKFKSLKINAIGYYYLRLL